MRLSESTEYGDYRTLQSGRTWRRIAIVIGAAAALVLGTFISGQAAYAAPTAAPAAVTAPTAAAQRASFDAELISLVNQARKKGGVPTLTENKGLTSLAVTWSRQMLKDKKLYHMPNGLKRAQQSGASNLTTWGENVGRGPVRMSAKQLFDAYWNSPSHRANIMSPKYRYIGMGTVGDSTTAYNSMEFTDKVDSTKTSASNASKKGAITAVAANSNTSCHPFRDVTSANVHCPNIAWLKKQGITKPVSGNYGPHAKVTRGQMMTFLYRIAHPGKAVPKCSAQPFRDVPRNNMFCGAIAWAKKAGIVSGAPSTTFGLNTAVNRGHMAIYMYRLANPGKAAPSCTKAPFTDISRTHYQCGYITWARTANITFGAGGGKYSPNDPITRGSMSSFLHRIHNHLAAARA